jgi:hypothetical protein
MGNMVSYQEHEKEFTYPMKKENYLPQDDTQRRVFWDGQFQGWEYIRKDDDVRGLDIFYCFLEDYRVGQYLLSLSSVGMAKKFVAGIQKWIDEVEAKSSRKLKILLNDEDDVDAEGSRWPDGDKPNTPDGHRACFSLFDASSECSECPDYDDCRRFELKKKENVGDDHLDPETTDKYRIKG